MHCDAQGKWKAEKIEETMEDVKKLETCNSDTTTSPPEPESQMEKRDRLLHNRVQIKNLNKQIETAKKNAAASDGLEEDEACEKFIEQVKEGKSYSLTNNNISID